MIKLVNVCKKYGDLVIFDNVNITFPSKGFIYISGESGKGKTTLLNMLSMIDSDYEGDIYIDDIDYKTVVDKESFRGNNFSFVLQKNDLFPAMSIKDNIVLDKKENNINPLLEKLYINKDVNLLVNTLSGGEYKRVSFARAIYSDCKVLFVDEVTSSLDEENKKIIIEILNEISKYKLVFFISHDLTLKEFADDVYYIDDKNIIHNKNEVCMFKNEYDFSKKKMSLAYQLKYIFSQFKVKKLRLFLVILTIVMSLMCFGLSWGIINLVSSELYNSMNSLVNQNYSVLRRKLKEDKALDILQVEESKLIMIKEKYPMLINYIGTYYFSNFEQQLKDLNKFYVKLDDISYEIPSLSVRSINDYEITNLYTLNSDEIVLKLTQKTIDDIALRLNIDNDITALKQYIYENSVNSYFNFVNLEWEYECKVNLEIKDVILSDENKILHSSFKFNEYIFEDIMKFNVSNNMSSIDPIPWTFKKIYYLKINIDIAEDVLNVLMSDSEFKDLSFDYLECVSFSNNLDKKKELSGRICLTYNINDCISLSSFKDVNNIVSYSYPNVYMIVDTFAMASFVSATFISNDIQSIIEIEENYNVYDYNLNYHKINSDSNIIQGGLLKLGENDNLQFKNQDMSNNIIGKKASLVDEIVISKAVADTLFKGYTYSDILNKNINYLTVRNVNKVGESYVHNFEKTYLKIVGIVDSDNTFSLYHNLNYLTHLYSKRLDFPLSSLYVDGALIEGEYDNKLEEKFLIKNPSKELLKSVDDALMYIDYGLMFFGVLTCIISLVSLCVILYLFIEENKRELGLFTLLGFNIKDVKRMFVLMGATIPIIAWFYTALSLFISFLLLEYEFYNSINFSSFNLYLKTIATLLLIVLIISPLLSNVLVSNRLKSNNSVTLADK